MMTGRSTNPLGLLAVVLAVVCVQAACSRADLYAITDDEPTAAGDGRGEAGPTADGARDDASVQPIDCPLPARTHGDTQETVQVDGLGRTFVLHIPPTYDGSQPAPLIVDFHRMGGSGSSQLMDSPYPPVTDPEGVIMAFPDGKKGPIGTDWNLGPCCVSGVDDVAFTKSLVAEIQKTVCIDARRVYATGATTGGGMVHYLACRAAEVFAAVAPAGFDLLKENANDCKPARPITVVSSRGTAETLVPYAGGVSSVVPGMTVTLLGAEETFRTWAQIDGCDGAPSPQDGDGCSAYSGCRDGAEVILCTEQGSRDEPRDARLAWPVLQRHSL